MPAAPEPSEGGSILRAVFARDPLPNLMIEKLFVVQHVSPKLLLQQSAEFLRAALFRFGRGAIGQRSFELLQLFAG